MLHNALHSGVGDKTCVCVCLRVAVAVNPRPASPSLCTSVYLQESAGDGDRLGRLPAARAPHPGAVHVGVSAIPGPASAFRGRKAPHI